MHSFVRFLIALRPELVELARALFDKYKGDPEPARAELRKIRDHGARLDAAESDIDRRMAEAEARERDPKVDA